MNLNFEIICMQRIGERRTGQRTNRYCIEGFLSRLLVLCGLEAMQTRRKMIALILFFFYCYGCDFNVSFQRVNEISAHWISSNRIFDLNFYFLYWKVNDVFFLNNWFLLDFVMAWWAPFNAICELAYRFRQKSFN